MAKLPIENHFTRHFGQGEADIRVVRAPGRVNIIGEHTDYNEGFVFPAAINRYITMAGNLRSDRQVKIFSVDFAEEASFSLDNLERDAQYLWANYPAGVIKLITEQGQKLYGMNLAITGNIPLGAGLSSSAALELATAYLVQALHGLVLSPLEIIRLCQQAENQFVGVNCGIMDQYISCAGKKGHALLIDCRSLEAREVQLLPIGVKLVITNSKVKHNLVNSAYNQRRLECEEACTLFSQYTGVRKKALRDVSMDEFESHAFHLPELLHKRAEHVIYENRRVLDGLKILADGDLSTFGQMMYQSHHSLKVLYEVSCDELDLLVDTARKVKGVYGSRMTGGGFGGCTVSLVAAEDVESFITYVREIYQKKTGVDPDFYLCDVVDGASTINPVK